MKSSRSLSSALAELWVPLLILLVFGIYHGCITFVNHAQFRTNAFDLGYYTHTVYEFGHLRLGEHVLENSIYWHTFGDHFEPILILLGPLIHVFGNQTMLIVQWAAILLGAIGAYRYFKLRSDDKWLPPIAMAQFLAIWGNSSALSFDFHAVVLGAMIVPWMLLFFYKRDRWRFVLCLLLFVFTGEKVAFWGVFVFLGLALLHLRSRRDLLPALASAVFCLVWTVVSLKYVIPSFLHPGKVYQHFDFKVMGNNLSEVASNALADPVKALRLLFESHTPEEHSSLQIKMELWRMIALAGGIGMLRRPQYLLMLAPILLTKLYNDSSVRWGINFHYSIEFVPILCIAVYEWVKDIRIQVFRRVAAVLVLLITIIASMVSLFDRCKWNYRPESTNVFHPLHWTRPEYDIRNIEHAISLIPPDVPVSASDRIVPHIPLREKVYFFPTVRDDAEYVVLQLILDTYPIPQERAAQLHDEMIAGGLWKDIWKSREVVVMQRVHP